MAIGQAVIDAAADASLASQLALRGRTVIYRRGTTAIPWTAMQGRTAAQAQTADGAIVEVRVADWIMTELPPGLMPPAPGDEIQQFLPSGMFRVYEVVPIGGESCWGRIDGTSAIRVHSQVKSGA